MLKMEAIQKILCFWDYPLHFNQNLKMMGVILVLSRVNIFSYNFLSTHWENLKLKK